MAQGAYILTIKGCPFAFGTAGVDLSILPTTSTDWPSGITSSNVIVAGLDSDSISSWEESIDVVNSTFAGTGMNFRLYDKLVTYDGAIRHIATYLFTRTDQEEMQLASSLLATTGAGSTFAVQAPQAASGTNFVVWIDAEAILCSSVSGTNITISQRGYYGTKVTDHKVDVTANYYPTVWIDYIGLVKQDVKLWRQDTNGQVYVIWRGNCQRAPRLSSDRTQIELQCEHIWNRIKSRKYEVDNLSTKMNGVDADAIRVRFSSTGVPSTFYSRFPTTAIPVRIKKYQTNRTTSEVALEIINDTVYGAVFAATGFGVLTQPSFPEKLKVLTKQANASMDVWGFIGGEPLSMISDRGVPATEKRGDYYEIPLTITERNVYQTFNNGIGGQVLAAEPFNALQDIPSFASSGSLFTCYTRPVFYSEIKDDQDLFVNRQDALLYFYPTGYSTGSTSSDRGMVFLTGSAVFYPKQLTENFDGPNQDYHGIAQPEELKYKISLQSIHWLDGLRYGLIERFEDARDWNFSNLDTLKTQIISAGPKSELILDGSETYEDIFSIHGKLFGCVPSTDISGSLTFRKIILPTASTPAVKSFTKTDLVDKPNWELNPESIITNVEVKSEGFSGEDKSIIFNDKGAISRFGAGETIDIDLSKIGSERWFVRNKEQLAKIIYRRFFSMFSKPYNRVTWTTTLKSINEVFPAEIVSLSDWIIPNGTGNRGLSDKKVLVISRKVDVQEGIIEYTALAFSDVGTKGWSPCSRISAVSGKTVTLSGSFLSATSGQITDYAGSNLSEYNNTANDFGLGFFKVGDKVELILRDSTTYSTFASTIQSINTTNKTITLTDTVTSSPVNWATEATSGKVDIRYNNYSTSGLQAAQQDYGWIGNVTTGQIQTSKKNQRFV